MIKKFLLLSLVASQLMISCSSDDSPETTDPVVTDPTKELTLEEEIALIVKQPYSSLTPAQQKLKLETEANEMLVQLDKSKSSGAIEAIENLGRLLSLQHIDLFDGKSDNGVSEVLNVSGVYGIYTWNNTQKIWVKTASTTELKFVFPAKESQTTNTAILSSKSTSSTIKFSNVDTYGESTYNEETGWTTGPSVQDWFYLPTAVDAILTIDGNQSATLASAAKYASNKSPEDYSYKITLNDGYTWEMSGKKGTQTTSKASFTYNTKNLLEFNFGSNAEIDALINTPELTQYAGKANGLVRILDNFVVFADTDLAATAADDTALEKSVVYPESPNYESANTNFKAYYTAINTYNQKYSAGTAANLNKNSKLILVSKKDGTKIADIVVRSEKDDYSQTINLPIWETYDGGGYWSWNDEGEEFTQVYYTEVYYLKFNDNTEVAMEVYFSEGFENLNTKFQDFFNSFNKQQ